MTRVHYAILSSVNHMNHILWPWPKDLLKTSISNYLRMTAFDRDNYLFFYQNVAGVNLRCPSLQTQSPICQQLINKAMEPAQRSRTLDISTLHAKCVAKTTRPPRLAQNPVQELLGNTPATFTYHHRPTGSACGHAPSHSSLSNLTSSSKSQLDST